VYDLDGNLETWTRVFPLPGSGDCRCILLGGGEEGGGRRLGEDVILHKRDKSSVAYHPNTGHLAIFSIIPASFGENSFFEDSRELFL
jgi:hypothetical protein